MHLLRRLLLAGTICLAASPVFGGPSAHARGGAAVQAAPALAGSRTLRLVVHPSQIAVGRDVTLSIAVTTAGGKPLPAQVTVTGAGNPAVGSAKSGALQLTVHAPVTGVATLHAVASGYAPLQQQLPIVQGSPATVMAIKHGLTIVAPRGKPDKAAVGSDLLQGYRARTAGGQLASLGLRDGSLVDLNSNTDVTLEDPLHLVLSQGELFIQAAPGPAAYQVQLGTAVVSANGARFDVQYAPAQPAVLVTVVEGRVTLRDPGGSVVVGAGQQTTIVYSILAPATPAPVALDPVVGWVQALSNTTSATVPPYVSITPPAPLPVTLPPWGLRPTVILSNTVSVASISGIVLITGTANLPAGAKLKVAPGTVVEFGPGALLQIDGTLSAVGKAYAPIVFTSASSFPHPGDWQALRIENSSASGSVLNHVEMFYGGYDTNYNVPGMLFVRTGANIAIENSLFAFDSTGAIYVDDSSQPTITNCSFAYDPGSPIDAAVDLFGQVTGIRLAPDQAPIVARPGQIKTSATWAPLEVPVVLTGTVSLNANVTLKLAPGTTIAMGANALFQVDGTLHAAGTSAAPITFTSAAAQPLPGDWQDLRIENTSAAKSVLDHVRIFYGGSDSSYNMPGALLLRAGANIVVRNSVIAQDSASGVYVDDGTRPAISGCLFAGDVGSPIDAPVDAFGQFTNLHLAAGQSPIVARAGTIGASTTWLPSAVPIVLPGRVTLAANVTLTLAPGTVIAMAPGAIFQVDGTLKAGGTADAPIVVTSAASQPQPGDWQALLFENPSAVASSLTHVQLLYGGFDQDYDVPGMLFIRAGANIKVDSTLLADDSTGAVYVDDGTRPVLSNLYFGADPGSPINAPVDALWLFTGLRLAPGQAPVVARQGNIQTTQTWQPLDTPVILTGTVNLAAGTTLTIAPGTTVQLGPGALVQVDGTLLAAGTVAAPITFTSAAAEPKPGDWQTFRVENSSAGKTVFSHVHMLYGGYDTNYNLPGMLFIRAGANISVTDSSFAQGSNGGIYVDNGTQPTITGNSFSSITGAAISMPAADQSLVHGNTFGPGQQGVQVRT